MLKVKNIHKSFGPKKVLDDVYFEVKEGSIFGLVGVNGAGKSTLLRTICGVYKPDRGEVLFQEKNTYENETIRHEIVYIADEPYFEIGSTLETMKTFYSSFYSFDEAAYEKYLKMFGLNPKESISNFSKGMKRQSALLFALSIHPKLMLLDEAFDGLDPLIRLNFKKALIELMEDEQISVIISSHNLKELEDICDSFGILEESHMSTYGDLLVSKNNINKYQLAFETEMSKDDFKDFDILAYSGEGRVVTVVIRGELEEISDRLMAMKPLLLDVLPVNFEELFIYEIESRGQDNA